MFKVAIFGAGQLGRRHLEGLVKSSQPITVHVVDPHYDARRAVQDYLVNSKDAALKEIHLHASKNGLPPELDVVIVATTANQRLEVIEQVLGKVKVRHIIMEKFLFNDSDHFALAGALIAKQGVRAWVNTPRRHFEFYRELREQSNGEQLLQFTVDGGDWGLCCNSVHFIDLLQFLTGTTQVRTLRTRLDEGVMQSKREGYVELSGEIFGELGNTTFTVRSVRGSTKPITVILHYKSQTYLVVEGEGVLWRIAHGAVESSRFRIPYQSEMTGKIVDQLLTTGYCDLTPYDDSVAAHLPLLFAFAKCGGTVSETRAVCAIT
jgi:predicted dehydrogenase